MTITESRLVKHDVSRTSSGITCDVEYDIDYSGVYDPLAAEAVSTLTPVGMGAPISVAWGAEIAADSGIYVVNKKATFGDCSTATLNGTYMLTLRYEESANVLTENPLDRPDQIFWSRAGESTPVFKDADDKPIITKAKEVFSEMPGVNVPRFSCTITGYRETYGFLRFTTDKYNVVNSDALNLKGVTVDAKLARYLSGQTRDERINGYNVIAYTWVLDFKESWDFKPMHLGNYELVSGKSVRIKDSLGLMRQTPWPLSAAGVALPDDYANADVNYLDFKMTVAVNFGSTFGWHFA